MVVVLVVVVVVVVVVAGNNEVPHPGLPSAAHSATHSGIRLGLALVEHPGSRAASGRGDHSPQFPQSTP